MTPALAAALALQGTCFLIWAVVFFRALFQVRRIAANATGRFNPGPVSFLRAAGIWMRDPAHRTARLIWLLSFAGLVAGTVLIQVAARG